MNEDILMLKSSATVMEWLYEGNGDGLVLF